jgi:hypothetical protein
MKFVQAALARITFIYAFRLCIKVFLGYSGVAMLFYHKFV